MCIGEGEQPFGQVNKTHHFHRYAKAVDARKLNPPFLRNEWEKAEKVKQKRRQVTLILDDFDVEKMGAVADDEMEDDQNEDEEGDLLDMYVCCQCSFYCVASGVIPGVIPRKHFDEFIRDKREHPPVGKSGELAIITGWETLIMCV